MRSNSDHVPGFVQGLLLATGAIFACAFAAALGFVCGVGLAWVLQ